LIVSEYKRRESIFFFLSPSVFFFLETEQFPP
jgi:hypothetical protein